MTQISKQKYDLEDRTLQFSKRILEFTQKLIKTIENVELIKQLIRSAGSVGANYIEANESLSKKDFRFRIKISKKEAKETCCWLKLIRTNNEEQEMERVHLINEVTELMKILGSILKNSR